MSSPKTLTVTECHQLLACLLCQRGTSKQFRRGIRNYTIALLMLDAGLRVGEVVRLVKSDLYCMDQPVANLVIRADISKSKSERLVPLSTRIRESLQTYLNSYIKLADLQMSDLVFRSSPNGKHLSTRQIERFIRSAALRSIGRAVHPHILRHTFGTRIERKAGIAIAQELLGHQHLTSTQIYMHPNNDDKRKAIDGIELEGLADVSKLPTLSVANRSADLV